jgi:hypothetical protein
MLNTQSDDTPFHTLIINRLPDFVKNFTNRACLAFLGR